MPWGKQTVVKFLGGELVVNTYASDPADWERIRLPAFARRMRNLTPVFNAIRPSWLQATRSVFAHEGPGWPRLAPSTLRTRRFPGRPILRQTDRLFRSVTGGPGMIWSARPLSLRYGSSVPYFIYHQRGGPRLPQRQMIVFGQQIRAELKRRSLRYIATGRP